MKPILNRLKGAGPAAVATTFVVGGTVAVVNTYAPEIGAFVDVQTAVAGVIGAIVGGVATVGGRAVKQRRAARRAQNQK